MKTGHQDEIKADGIQLENAKLLLVVKHRHEHRASRLFLDLRCRCRGDRGYAHEAKLLGGGLRHCHFVNEWIFSVGFPTFVVWHHLLNATEFLYSMHSLISGQTKNFDDWGDFDSLLWQRAVVQTTIPLKTA